MEEIVRILSRKGFPVSRCLERLPSLEQKKLGLADRFENARAAYRVRAGAFVPARIVLLDDVFTTGSTLDACANALKGHGAKAISALTVATD